MIRKAVNRTASWPPPDVIFFTRDEERHFDFLKRSGAVPLLPGSYGELEGEPQ
ncbi:MAG: hypothetical protein GY708_14560 [Actinomycetia bacterium]|nr:hypothetical protein [Actinomycetes bacterium]